MAVADSLSTLAQIKGSTGLRSVAEINEIEAMSRSALDIFERLQGKYSERSLKQRNDLAVILLSTDHDNKIQEATEIFRSLLASHKQSIGLEDYRTLAIMHKFSYRFG